MAFQIKEFDFNLMVSNPSILIIGKRGSGKSYIVRELLNHFQKIGITDAHIVSPTERMRSFYEPKFPKSTIEYELKETTIAKLLIEASIRIETNRRIKQGEIDDEIRPGKVVILDDCLRSKDRIWEDSSFRELIMNGRHYELPYVLTMQFPEEILPQYRLNFDYVFLLAEDASTNKKSLWKQYASFIPAVGVFDKIFTKCTENYRCMVINNRTATDSIFEKMYHYKANSRDDDSDNDQLFVDIPTRIPEEDWTKSSTSSSTSSNSDDDELIPLVASTDITQRDSNNDSFTISYADYNHRVMLKTDNLSSINPELIKILCNHIQAIKTK
jgi:GTPase SAR1 family protein